MTKSSGWPGKVQSASTATCPARVGSTPACSVSMLPSDDACTPAAQIFVPRRAARAIDVWTSMPPASTRDQRPRPDLDAQLLEVSCRAPREALAKLERISGAVSSSTMRAAAGVEAAGSSSALWRDSSATWPASSTPVGPAPTTRTSARSAARRVRLELGELEGAEDPAAQLERVVDRLHARRVAGELVVAEVGLRRTGRDDQAVVRQLRVRSSSLRL